MEMTKNKARWKAPSKGGTRNGTEVTRYALRKTPLGAVP